MEPVILDAALKRPKVDLASSEEVPLDMPLANSPGDFIMPLAGS